MAKHERYGEDGITETRSGPTFRLDRPLGSADRETLVAAMKRAIDDPFEAKIRALEPDLQLEVPPRPAYGSRAYYARELLDAIARVRKLREAKSRSDIDAALAWSMRVGFLASECWAKREWPVVGVGARRAEWQRTIVLAVRAGVITAADRAMAIAHCEFWAT